MRKPKLTEEERKERNRERSRQHREKLKSDPERLTIEKAKAKARLEKKMANPEYVIGKRERDWASQERYRQNHPDEIRERNRKMARAIGAKRRQDPAFILLCRIRRRTRKICRLFKLGNIPKVNKERFVDYFGAAPEVVVAHIESQFTSGMTRESYDKTWHIDHIIPISAWNGDKNLLVRLNHYKNLRPLLAAENLQKGDKMPDFFPEGVPFTREEVGFPIP